MKTFVVPLIFTALSAAAPSPQASGAPPNSQVEIQDISYRGTGCPDKSATGLLSDDRTTLTLLFDKYTVESGPDILASSRRKFCQLQVKIRYPGGFQYSTIGADYRGYANLQANVTGTVQSTYYFSGQQNQTVLSADYVGPVSKNYLKHDEVDSASTIWSPCGENGMLNIKSEVRINSLDTSTVNLLTMDSFDAKFTQKYFVQWQTCGTTEPSSGVFGQNGALADLG